LSPMAALDCYRLGGIRDDILGAKKAIAA